MKENTSTSIAIIKDSKPAENRFAEQLYYSAGLGPEVDEGIREYEQHIQGENKLLNKVLGARGSDIRGYGEAVAKRVAIAVYNQLSQQYGGKVGDLRSYIMTLEEERDRANSRYDDLMGRAIGILGEEYKELKSDSNEFMEKLTTVMGEDLKASRINSEALTEKLADIDGLRSEIRTLAQEKELLANTLAKEKEQLKEKSEQQIAEVTNQHQSEIRDLNFRIVALAKEKEYLADTSAKEKEQLKEKYESQITALNNEHKGEIRNLNEKYESQIAEANNDYKAEIRKLNSRVEILTKEKELQKEQYESQIVELDSKIRSLESKKSNSTNEPKQ